MREFEFLATWNDNWAILEDVLVETSAILVPDKWYQRQDVLTYVAVTAELMNDLYKKRRVFICARDAKLFPTRGLVEQKTGPRQGEYRIQHNEIGETLALTLAACYKEAEIIWLGRGSLVLATEYLDHTSMEWTSPSKSLFKFYNQVRSSMQRHLILTERKNFTAWLGIEAKQLIESGSGKISDLTGQV